MTDFYSVLQRAVSSLPDGSGPNRRAVYDKARKALLKQLQSFDPPLPSSDVTAQRLALEDAIRKIENEIARQIRTQRALQTAMPSGKGGVRRPAAGEGLTGAAASAAAAKAAEAERAAKRAAEAEAARRQNAALLENAISEATIEADAEAEADIEAEDLGSAAPVPVPAHRYADVEDEPHDDGRMFEDEAEDYDAPHHLDERTEHDDIVDGEYDEVDAGDDVAAVGAAPSVEPRAAKRGRNEERRARKDEERRLKAERRAARRSDRKATRAATADEGRRGRSRKKAPSLRKAVLPIVLLALLVGAAYAAYTQREALMAVFDELQEDPQKRPPITVTSRSGVDKNSDRLPSTLDGEDTRTVTTTAWPPTEGDAPADGAEASGEAAAPPTLAPPPDRTVGNEVSPFAPEAASTTAEERVASVNTDGVPDAAADGAADAAEEGGTAAEEEVASAEPQATATVPETPQTPISEFTASGTQQAVLYEEAPQAGEQGTAVPGGVEWSMVRESVGGGDPEPVIRATAEIPERDMTATITVRENLDGALPASHLIEISFELPEGFEGGGVKNVPGVIMKQNEQSRGEALRGAAARVSSGLFWIALSENELDRESNLKLLRERDWIDIPILYESGRRAILTLRKGSDGFQSVNAAIQAWSPG